MKKFILSLFISILSAFLYADNNICVSGSKYASEVTPVGAVDIYGSTPLDNYPTIRKAPPQNPNDPFPNPIGEGILFLTITSCVYVVIKTRS